jgi:hypothetical protein
MTRRSRRTNAAAARAIFDLAAGPDADSKQYLAAHAGLAAPQGAADQQVAAHLYTAREAIKADNFGQARQALDAAAPTDDPDNPLVGAFVQAIRRHFVPLAIEAKAHGYGEALIAWMEQRPARGAPRRHAYAPLYIALLAFVRGERQLLNFNPVFRIAADPIYSWFINSHNPENPERSTS